MDYLSRDAAPLTPELWNKIDDTVVKTASRLLVGRRFISLYGPLGAQAFSVQVDDALQRGAIEEDGPVQKTGGRVYKELPLVYSDATLSWRELEHSLANGLPIDLSAVADAAAQCARKEDELIFFGSKALGYEGLFTAPAATHFARSDWKAGENPYADVAKGMALFNEKGLWGRLALVVSPDLYAELMRLQPGTGKMELERLNAMLDGNVFRSPFLGSGKALLVSCDAQYMDLAVGQDIAAAYLETKDLNHSLRILETALLRIKRADAIIVFD